MKILYGVTGEGMGHATRSKVVLSHLLPDHQLLVVASGKAHEFLTRYFPEVINIEGLRITYEDGAVDRSATFLDLLERLPKIVARNAQRFAEISIKFSPDVVISDFESFAYLFGISHNLPVISIDNMQVLNRCDLSDVIPDTLDQDYLLAKSIVKAKLPGCYHYMITSFFFPPVINVRTSLHPPILRQEILDAQPSQKDHILVYQTSTSDRELLDILKQVDAKFKVYGFRREEQMGNVQLRDFSEAGFVEDLSSCRAVLATGGFSLMSEAVYLGKPYLAVPVRKQFEQVLNSLYLDKLGYGEYHEKLSTEIVDDFLTRDDDNRENLKAHTQDGNKKILAALDELLASL